MKDPERRIFCAVIGATNGRPIVVPEASGLLRHDKTVDQSAVSALLAQNGITGRIALLQQTAALGRAYNQALEK
jgi:hypothetical protein